MTRTQDRSRRPIARRAWIGGASALAIAVTTLIVPAGTVTQAEAARVQPRTVYPTTTLAVIKTISVGDVTAPGSVAVNDTDDTVYVANLDSKNVSVIKGRTGQLTDDTIAVGSDFYPIDIAVNEADDTVYVTNDKYNSLISYNYMVINGRDTDDSNTRNLGTNNQPYGVAVDQDDDTVYVVKYQSAPNFVWVVNGLTGLLTDDTINVGSGSFMVAVDQDDDTVYVTNNGSDNVSVLSGRTNQPVTTIPVGDEPNGVAVNQDDDTVYVVNRSGGSTGTVSVINGRTNTVVRTVGVGNGPNGVAVDQGDDTVYVTNANSNNVSVINGRTGQLTDDTVSVGTSPVGVAVDDTGTNAGLVYVTNADSNNVSVIGRVTPSLVATCGSADDTATINLTVPNLSTGFVMDPSTVTSVTFDTTVFTPGAGLSPAAGNKWEFRVPARTGAATVPVTVLLKGSSRTTSAGNFTYGCTPPPPPTPTPPTPAGAPSDIKATPGDNSATITWVAPASSGSYPITDYQAIASPGGRTCLVPAPALSCEITGLTSGTSYTFTVQALTGAGWSPASSPSNSITPTPSPTPTITITGSRDDKRIIVTGTTTELVGKTLRPWRHFQGQTTYTEGIVAITPAADGSFTWKRKTGKKIYVYIAHESTRSNTVIIPAR